MRVIVTADVQLHNHNAFARILPDGRNSRLQDGIDALCRVAALAESGDTVVINGDVFETQKAVDTSVTHAFADWVYYTLARGVELVLVVGNHDQYTRAGEVHALAAYRATQGVTVVDRPTKLELGSDLWFLMPYSEDLDAVRQFIAEAATVPEGKDGHSGHRFLCLHQAVSGARLENSVFEGGLALGELRADCFEAVLLGHFHRPQSLLPNVHYIGSPYQVTPDEHGQNKRALVVEGGQTTSVVVPGRGFVLVGFDEFLELHKGGKWPNAYYRVICSEDGQAEKLRRLCRQHDVLAEPLWQARPRVADESPELKAVSWGQAIARWLERHQRPDLLRLALARAGVDEA